MEPPSCWRRLWSSNLLPKPPGPADAATRGPPRYVQTTEMSPLSSSHVTSSVPRARDSDAQTRWFSDSDQMIPADGTIPSPAALS